MNTFKKIICLLLCLIFVFSFSITAFAEDDSELVTSFKNPNGRVLSVANLGNTRSYPENSLEGIQDCITIGVDAVLVKVQLTKDNQLVLLSNDDLSINCAIKADGNDAMGKVSDYSLDDLQSKFCLKAGHGGNTKATGCGIASLKEVVSATSGKIIIIVSNGATFAKEINALANELNCFDTVVIAGFEPSSLTDIKSITMSSYSDSSKGSAADAIETSITGGANILQLDILKSGTLEKASGKIRLLINMSEKDLCGDLEDRTAGWSKAIELGYSMIVTDYPSDLVKYLSRVEELRTNLSTLIGDAESMNTSAYTKSSVKALNNALKNAKETSGKGSLSLDKADEAYYNLQESIDALVTSAEGEKLELSTGIIIVIVVATILVTIALVVLVLRFVNKIKKGQKKLEKFKKKFNSDIPIVNDESLSTNIAEDEESNMGIIEETEIAAESDEASEKDIEDSDADSNNEDEIIISIDAKEEPKNIEENAQIEIVDIIGDAVAEENSESDTEE